MNARSRLQTTIRVVLAAIALAGAPVLAEQVVDLRLGLHEDKTRLVFDLSGPVAYSITTMDDPPRLIIDIPEADLTRLPRMSFTGTPISDMSTAAGASGGLIVTFNFDRAVASRSYLLAPNLPRGDRLVVDLYEEPLQQIARAGAQPSPSPEAAPQNATADTPEPIKPPASAETSSRETVSRPTPTAASNSGPRIGFSGTWTQEWAYQTDDTGTQKFESLVEPRVDINFASGSQLVAIARVRLDTEGDLGRSDYRPDNYSDVNGPSYNTEYAELSLRELYLDTEWAGIYWRLGKQQVVWGQADGIKVLDVVNPQSFREFILDDFDDSRIPLWMVNAELPLGEGGLQLLWIPDTTYHELAEPGSPYFLTSSKWVPDIPPGTGVQVSSLKKPNNAFDDSDLGVRYSTFLGGWDITLNYLYHYQDYPVLYQQLEQHDGVDILQVAPDYKRNHLFGGTLSNAFDSFTLRAELAYSTDTYHSTSSLTHRGIRESAEVASVLGLDWQYSGDGLLSAQWFLSHLPDHSSDVIRSENENIASLLFQQSFANETWQLRTLGLYSLDDEDSLLQFKLKYWMLSNLEVWLGADFFGGTQRGSFGQFNEQDRVLLGLEYGF